MKKTTITILVIAAAIFVINSCCDNSKPPATTNQDIDKNPAMNNPDKFAWQLFVEINKPFDEKKPDGSTVWENWALVRKLFSDPNKAPTWQDATNGNEEMNQRAEELRQQLRIDKINQPIRPQFDPHAPLSNRQGGLSEVRINKSAFDFIVSNNLFNQEGQQSFIQNKKIDLNPDAKEVKAVWDTIQEKDKDKYHYVIQKGADGKDIYWGLVAFHITTKDIPNWFWATFEHVDNPKLKDIQQILTLANRDNYGIKNGKISEELENDFKKNNIPSVWKNYILRGAQTDFGSSTGVPIILANSYIENRFLESSSCMSCHSRATTGSSLAFEELPKEVQDSLKGAVTQQGKEDAKHFFNSLDFVKGVVPNGQQLPISNDDLIMFTGYPDPNWFAVTYSPTNRKDTYKQLDFMWSMTRAKRIHPYEPK